ncbi:MAG: CpsD/CapB family tyrosine-protein kinase [Bacteroidetes bacterium]|nr:CpsD/CapB family tyrosine-protein kinase [Bacteroidota bacterium]
MPSVTDELITIADPRSPVSEAYRTLRTNIQFSSLDRPLHTILVTSTNAEEGKSTTVANLAVTFAQAGHRTIAVDSDLRRPSLHKLFGVPNESGLTTLVLDESAELIMQTTEIPNLRVLPSGPLPPNPAELLASQRMDRIVETLKAEADFVLFDCSPIVAVTDAAVLARRVDGVLLIVSAGRTKREHAARAKAQLEKVNANIIGVVLNNVKADRNLYQYYSQ